MIAFAFFLLFSAQSQASDLSPAHLRCGRISEMGAPAHLIDQLAETGLNIERPFAVTVEGAAAVIQAELLDANRVARAYVADALVFSEDGHSVSIKKALPPMAAMLFGNPEAIAFGRFAQETPKEGCELSAVLSAAFLRRISEAKALPFPFKGNNVGLGLRWSGDLEHIGLGFFSLSGDALKVLRGSTPRALPTARGPERPKWALRVNADWIALLALGLSAVDPTEQPDELKKVSEMMQALQDSRIRFAPGAELAVFSDDQLSAVLPLKRPHKASKVIKKLLKAEVGTLEGDVLRLQVNGDSLYLAASGRALVVGASDRWVREQVMGVGGVPWFSGDEGVGLPGVYLVVNTPDSSAVESLGRAAPRSDLSLHLRSQDDVLWFDMSLPDLKSRSKQLMESRRREER